METDTEKAMAEILDFVKTSPPEIAKIALLYLTPEDQKVALAGFEQLEKERPLSSQETSAKGVLHASVLEDVRKLVAEFSAEHGLNIEAPLPPLIENDALNLGEDMKAALEAKQDSDDPPHLADGGPQNGDGPNGGDNNAGDLNGLDDDHKEGAGMEGEHVR
jgi:hypothetical protein